MIDTPNHGERLTADMPDEKIPVNLRVPPPTLARIRTAALGNGIKTFSLSHVVTSLVEYAFSTMSESEIEALLRETVGKRRRPR